MDYTPFTVDQNLAFNSTPVAGGLDNNALMSLMLAGQSLMNFGSDTSKPIDLATPVASYMSNISKAALMKQLLAGKKDLQGNQLNSIMKDALNPNTTTEAKLSGKGLNVTYDPNHSVLKGLLGGGEMPSVDQSLAPTATPATQASAAGGSGTTPNPFSNQSDTSFDNLTAGDLAGLTTKDIEMMLVAKHGQDQLKQESYKTIMDSFFKGGEAARLTAAAAVEGPYKQALTKQAIAAANENTPSVDIMVGERAMKVTPKDAIAWEKLKKETTPSEVKVYDEAVRQGYKGSIVDFKNIDMTGHEKDFRAAKADGYGGSFNTWLQESIKNGAITLGDTINKQEALDKVKRQSEVQSPDLSQKIEKQLSANRLNWSDPPGIGDLIKQYPNIPREQLVQAKQREMVRVAMDTQIKQAYPEAQYVKSKGWMVGTQLIVRDPYAK